MMKTILHVYQTTGAPRGQAPPVAPFLDPQEVATERCREQKVLQIEIESCWTSSQQSPLVQGLPATPRLKLETTDLFLVNHLLSCPNYLTLAPFLPLLPDYRLLDPDLKLILSLAQIPRKNDCPLTTIPQPHLLTHVEAAQSEGAFGAEWYLHLLPRHH